MIEYVHGNIFESKAKVITNPVNTVGVMGAGLALQFKQKYPNMFNMYQVACDNNLLTIGKLMLIKETDHTILLFPTKKDWRDPSQLSYIEAGLRKFVSMYEQKGVTSVAFSKLGCGLGGLKWEVVKPIMEKYLKPLPIVCYIYV